MQGASTYHREMFAITQAMSKWRQHLLGCKFTIFTDQQSLRNLTNQTIQTTEQQKWLNKLVGFNFQIIYRPGKLNQVTNCLSHYSDPVLLLFLPEVMSLRKNCNLLINNIPNFLISRSNQKVSLLHICVMYFVIVFYYLEDDWPFSLIPHSIINCYMSFMTLLLVTCWSGSYIPQISFNFLLEANEA